MTRLDQSQVDMAYRLYYGDGKNLGEIATEIGCGLYDLTPWLTAPLARIAGDDAAQAAERIAFLRERIEHLEKENVRLASRP